MARNLVEITFDSEKKYIERAAASWEDKPTKGIITGSLCFDADTGNVWAFEEISGVWSRIKADLEQIAGATVNLGSSLTYDGTLKTQAVSSVVLGETVLTANTDYILKDNQATDAGTYTLYVVGIGKYSGIVAKTFTIAKANGSVTASPDSLTLTADGDAGTSTLTVVGDGEITVASADTSVADCDVNGNTVTVVPGEAGSTTVTVTLADSANYNGSTDTISVTVEEAEATEEAGE